MGSLTPLLAARSLQAGAGANSARIGICTYSCHQHWKAVAANRADTKFTDVDSFYTYARGLGAEGVQTSLSSASKEQARRIRERIEKDGGYFEADLRLPKDRDDLDSFEAQVRLAREAGATVARAVCMGGRRYEVFTTRAEFENFRANAERSLSLAEPIAKHHQLRIAIENHKDHTTDELVALIRKLGSEWIGVLVDTGNNMALCEDPHAVVEALAPMALSVHFKDMAVQVCPDGFLLSEVTLGTGMLDLPRIIRTLRRANSGLVFNLEMITRDPLRVPCRSDSYWATFPDRKATHLESALARVAAHPPKEPPPQVSGKETAVVLAAEETNNRQGLDWMNRHLRA